MLIDFLNKVMGIESGRPGLASKIMSASKTNISQEKMLEIFIKLNKVLSLCQKCHSTHPDPSFIKDT